MHRGASPRRFEVNEKGRNVRPFLRFWLKRETLAS